MSRSRHLITPLLVVALLPAGATRAQTLVDGWAHSDDRLAFATNETLDSPFRWRSVEPADFPAAIADIPGPDMLYAIDGVAEGGARTVRLHQARDHAWLDDGRTPVLATAVADDDVVTWARLQHIVSLPAACPGSPGLDCVAPDLVDGLVDLSAPHGTPVEPLRVADSLTPGTFISSASIGGDGTIMSFGGGASVETTIRVGDDGKLAVRGQAHIDDGLGGRLRGFDVFLADALGQITWADVAGSDGLQTRARAVRDLGADPTGVNRRILECPAERRGVIVSQFFFSGVGRGVGPGIHPHLDGGVPVLVSEVLPFDCGPGPGADPAIILPDDPAAALVCASTMTRHRPLRVERDDLITLYNSFLRQLFAVVTTGVPIDAHVLLQGQVGQANSGDLFSVRMEGVQLDSAAELDVILWVGEVQLGIDTYGSKPFRRLDLSTGEFVFDLLDQQRALFGEAHEVGPGQQPVTNCPGFDFRLDDVGQVFSDGFESGDISAWAYTRPD